MEGDEDRVIWCLSRRWADARQLSNLSRVRPQKASRAAHERFHSRKTWKLEFKLNIFFPPHSDHSSHAHSPAIKTLWAWVREFHDHNRARNDINILIISTKH